MRHPTRMGSTLLILNDLRAPRTLPGALRKKYRFPPCASLFQPLTFALTFS